MAAKADTAGTEKAKRTIDPAYHAFKELDDPNQVAAALTNGQEGRARFFVLVTDPGDEDRRGGAHRQQGLVKATADLPEDEQTGKFLVIKDDELQFVTRKKKVADDFE